MYWTYSVLRETAAGFHSLPWLGGNATQSADQVELSDVGSQSEVNPVESRSSLKASVEDSFTSPTVGK